MLQASSSVSRSVGTLLPGWQHLHDPLFIAEIIGVLLFAMLLLELDIVSLFPPLKPPKQRLEVLYTHGFG